VLCVLCGLALQLGDAYHSLLDLPCDLSPSNGRSLDEQLQLLHGVISRAFRQSGLSAYDNDMGDEEMGGCFGVAAGEDSGVSGCNGGVCAGGGFDDEEE